MRRSKKRNAQSWKYISIQSVYQLRDFKKWCARYDGTGRYYLWPNVPWRIGFESDIDYLMAKLYLENYDRSS